MKLIHTLIQLLKKAANVENFEEEEKLMFQYSYERLAHHKQISYSVNEGLGLASAMVKNDWDAEMTCCSIEMMNEEANNSLYQKVVLVSLEKALEKKYFNI